MAAVLGTRSAGSTGTSVTTSALDTTGATLLIACSTNFDTEFTLTDSASNTWTVIAYDNSDSRSRKLWYCASPTTSASHTFTSTCSYGTGPTLNVLAASGTTASPLDQTGASTTSSATSLATSSITPSANGALIFGFTLTRNNTNDDTVNRGTLFGVKQVSGGPSYSSYAAYEIQSTAAATSFTFSGDNVVRYSRIVSFLAATGGGSFQPAWTRGSNVLFGVS
jgi:hypothetical protein